ncbi:zinc finger transcriptional activator [Saxophila tyrrhenica]|uniref:Zinc finger transcriptional activator n=1 Tax=Saxophila tyrrhenica TaxID=1690608 RepID=A0AAV9P7S8_9PEZI|nr:zinc finger transcriptional activator [Saxophila tyrrhenica]
MEANGFQMRPDGDVQYESPQPNKAQNAANHQRTYQACIPCRQRKVRCDLGSVDNPHDPPCSRCRRESKTCYFSATRRKKKRPGVDNSETYSDAGDDVPYEIKDGRKRARTSSGADLEQYDPPYDAPRTPGGSIGRTQPLNRPAAPKHVHYGEEDHKASEQTVGLLQAAEVHGGHDALKLLYEAATVQGGRMPSKDSGTLTGINGVSPASGPSITARSPVVDVPGTWQAGPMGIYKNDPMWTKSDIDYGIKSAPADPAITVNSPGYASAIKAWSRFRFVRAGWFTAREAIEYVEYFYKHLSPLTPVVLPDFRDLGTHEKLLTQEPMLTITILLISSRHMRLQGPGAVSRPYSIHQKLWTYLSGMINRVIWGQEQFGGGFCGAGAEPGCDVNPLSRKGLRTLGTVESLALLTEWHPRAMHFPPDEADDELMVPEESSRPIDFSEQADPSQGISGQRMDAWLEPCWRSDRLCWMLLGISMSLAFEIGVFDKTEWQRHARSTDGHPLSADELQSYDRRRGSVRDILLIYVSQTSGRLGLTSMLPSTYSTPEDSDLYKRIIGQHETMQETVLHFWLRMAAIMREGNHTLYANKTFTRDLIRNGDYKAALAALQTPLREWRQDFDKAASIPQYMRYILQIEFEYCRVYINALALQAVAERCANDQAFSLNDPPLELARNSAVSTNGVRSDVAIAPPTLAKWLGGDRFYLHEVGEASRNLLKVVVDGLYPGEYLRHAPVRTYFRIVSVAIMLLKSFSLGASESDVQDSLTLMDKTVAALKGCIVDDVHVASRFADLLNNLTQNLKPRLVRIAGDGRSGRSRRVSHQGSPEPLQAQLGTANQKLQQHQQQTSMNGVQSQNQQQWAYNTTSNPTTMAPNHPMYGISSDAYDLSGPDNNFSVMPPPSFGFQSPTNQFTQPTNNTTPGGSAIDPYLQNFSNDNSMQDWLTLPLDPLLNMNGADVTQTMYGPQLGESDMLELLLGPNNYGV